ncbi:MAG: hypothetical protein HC822_03705, partial [Oscillochloris sp.]|nr:hypothetical protein [Oscillochloris sp.]
PPAGHHTYAAQRYTGSLTAEIVAHSPVHIGSGLLEPMRGKHPLVKGIVRSMVDGELRPVIPGTSLKGCIRAIVEAISRSRVQVTRARELPRQYVAGRSVDELDVAQRIFGTLGYQGCVRFGNAVLQGYTTTVVESVQLFRPRPESVRTYFDGVLPKGRKFYMHGKPAKGDLPLEACDVGSRFAVRMDFEQLSAGELGLLLIAMGLGDPSFYPKLGGAKPACLGTIAVTDPQITAYSGAAAYSDFDAKPESLDPIALFGMARAEGLLETAQLEHLAEILRWPPAEDRECPDRNY